MSWCLVLGSWCASIGLYVGMYIPAPYFYFNHLGSMSCEPYYTNNARVIIGACAVYFPTTMVSIYFLITMASVLFSFNHGKYLIYCYDFGFYFLTAIININFPT